MRELQIQYQRILADYIESQTERNLYIGQNFIRQLIQKNITPEDVISIHKLSMEQIVKDLPAEVMNGYDFLIEMMVHFGLTVREHQSLLEQQEELRIEMNVATKIQQMLLKTTIPEAPQVDVGMVSIPIRKMNGDYVHFLHKEASNLSIAVTDVVGKGVPAALCMSMVKYGLDTLEFANGTPSYVLEILNQIIERSVDDSMFVSMFFGRYDIVDGVFTYSSAGHEPALHYIAAEDRFEELNVSGLLLGVMSGVKYEQREVKVREGDFIVMMTDGVTEFRKQDDELTQQLIRDLLYEMKHLPAQEMCEGLYKKLQDLQDYGLEDDFTVVILKKY